MFCIEEISVKALIVSKRIGRVACLGTAMLLCACAPSMSNLSSDFGIAVTQDLAAQIADPDARYAGNPEPGTNGVRVGAAQSRYEKGQVIPPTTLTTTTRASSADNGNNGNGSNSGNSGGTLVP